MGYDGDEVYYDLREKDAADTDLGITTALECKVVKNFFMTNGDFMPLSRQESLPSMVDCTVDFNQVQNGVEYFLAWTDENFEMQQAGNPITFSEKTNSRFSADNADCFRPMKNLDIDR